MQILSSFHRQKCSFVRISVISGRILACQTPEIQPYCVLATQNCVLATQNVSWPHRMWPGHIVAWPDCGLAQRGQATVSLSGNRTARVCGRPAGGGTRKVRSHHPATKPHTSPGKSLPRRCGEKMGADPHSDECNVRLRRSDRSVGPGAQGSPEGQNPLCFIFLERLLAVLKVPEAS